MKDFKTHWNKGWDKEGRCRMTRRNIRTQRTISCEVHCSCTKSAIYCTVFTRLQHLHTIPRTPNPQYRENHDALLQMALGYYTLKVSCYSDQLCQRIEGWKDGMGNRSVSVQSICTLWIYWAICWQLSHLTEIFFGWLAVKSHIQ